MEMAAWVLLILVTCPTLVLAAELIAAQMPVRRIIATASPTIVIIIPAHDEAAGIADMIGALRSSAPPEAKLLVVADNCSDDTAEMARAAGAETIERQEPELRGKSFALGFARRHLADAPPDIVIILDADCTVEGDGIARLAGAAQQLGRPVQSAYLMRPRPERGGLVSLSSFAFLIRNLVRQRGLSRLGAPALLTGSGMALPWRAFAAAPLDNDDLVEDLAIGIALARIGLAPAFLGDTTTWSDPARRAATLAQRSRWEQGFLRHALRAAPSLIGTGRWPLSWLGLHLTVPPLALLLLIDLVALLLLAAAPAPLPFTLLAGLLGLLAILLLLSWARFGRQHTPARGLLLIPFYILWKLPLYAAALLRPEKRWIRTDRD